MAGKSILLIADPYIPVPPITYGGIERIVDMLAEGLAKRGWQVSLACHPDSSCRVNLIPLPAAKPGSRGRVTNTTRLLKHIAGHRFDIVHSFAHYDLTALLWPLAKLQIQSFQAFPDWESFTKRTRLIPKRNLHFTTCGHHMVDRFTPIAPTHSIHNGIILDQFNFRAETRADAPLVFLGRIEPIKGTHLAIEIAKAADRELIIAGNRSDKPAIDAYFTERVEPHLSDRIRYIGPVNDVQKNELLGKAAAFLMPIEWDEPFGIVMAEALACGTPVIGFARGALPEIVNDGITGACCHTVEEMIEAVLHLEKFSREDCRLEAEKRFSSPIIIEQYVSLYETLLSDQTA
jgi:glycosyltransferase involved in cell wall biosynthesis